MKLTEQVLSILDGRADYAAAGAYYEGDVAEVFATHALKRAMSHTAYDSRLNFCRPVVDAVQNRLELSAVLGTSDAANQVIQSTWENNELYLESNESHRNTLVYGDSYAIVWPDEDGELYVSFKSPLSVAVVYDPERPRKKLYAVQMWEDLENTYMNVYWADRIQKYSVKGTSVTEGVNWTLTDTLENPFGEVPVFHFRTGRPYGRPEHKDAYDAQNYINKQFIQSMYVADYQGAPQRYALSHTTEGGEADEFEEGDTERENANALKNGPGELWYLKGIHTVGQFQPADPNVFWQPIKDTVRSMASLTNTPLHYFEKTGNVPSGEALRVAEAPLIKKVNDRQESLGQTWRELFRFVLKVNDIEEDVQVKWKDIESLDVLELWDAALKKRNAGMSIKQVLLEMGYDSDVADNVIAEAKAERDAGQAGYQRAPETRVQPQNDERNVDQ